MKRILSGSSRDTFPVVMWLVVLLLGVGLIVPLSAYAAPVSLSDITKVSIVAYREKDSTTLIQRIFVSEDVPLPCTVSLPWPADDAVAKSQQSDGEDWWGLSTTVSGGKITYTLTKGRIAEFESALGDIYKPDGNAMIAAVPVKLAQGIKNVEVGCSLLDGYRCIYPDTYQTNFRSGTYDQIVVNEVNLARGYQKEELLFGFVQIAIPDEGGNSAAPIDFSHYDQWPLLALLLLVLAILFSAIVTYIIAKTTDKDEPEPEDPAEDDELDDATENDDPENPSNPDSLSNSVTASDTFKE